MSVVEAKVPSVKEVEEAIMNAEDIISKMTVVKEGTIQDYPIGGANRGLCKLEVEYSSGKGFRTVRTTTNKRGWWCAPKKSTYADCLFQAVVTGEGVEHEFQWLVVTRGSVYLRSASGQCTEIVPMLVDPYTLTDDLRYTVNGESRIVEKSPQEQIDAFKAFRDGLIHLAKLVKHKLETDAVCDPA